MKDLLFGGARFNSIAGDVGLLVVRVFAGLALALGHGLGKLPPSPQFQSAVEGLGPPPQMAWLSGIAETIGGLGLAAGLATRVMGLIVAGNMSVAVFLQHANDPFGRKELAAMFLAVAVLFLFAGGGRFSLDRFIKR
jgi:putative oxidoreductase